LAGLNIQPIAAGFDAGTKVQLIDNAKEAVVQGFPGVISAMSTEMAALPLVIRALWLLLKIT